MTLPKVPAVLLAAALAYTQAPSAHDRALALLQSVQTTLAQPASAERDARLEGLVQQLDALPAADALDQQFTAHQRMRIYYNGTDQTAGVVKHATWTVDAARRSGPDARKKNQSAIVSAYTNLAQSWASQGDTDKAIALLRRIGTDVPEIPTAPRSVQPDLDRLLLVGTPAAPIKAAHWLNMPPNTTSLDLKGQVTLLEFSAHWCVPCKESYPVVGRLRDKYGARGFRVVLATELYGFFEREASLTADAELTRDRAYFAATKLNVPTAIADGVHNPDENPNSTNYKVGGLPQLMLIDRRGIIRLMMVGFDKSSEPRLAQQVEALLNQK